MRKIFLLVLALFGFTSCFAKLDEKKLEGNGEVKINLSAFSKEIVSYEYERIAITLTNTESKESYFLGVERKSGEKKNMLLENVAYGTYDVLIEIYKSGVNIPYSIIKTSLSVGREVPQISGFIGAPLEASNLKGTLKYYEDDSDCVYVDFECSIATSNLVDDLRGEDIIYKVYGSSKKDFSDKILLMTINLEDIRHPNQTGENTVVLKRGNFYKSKDLEIPLNLINGKEYYWMVETTRLVGTEEKSTLSDVCQVVSRKYEIDNRPAKISNIDRAPSQDEFYWEKGIGFSWNQVTSISNDSRYNDISYKVYISPDENFSTYTVIEKEENETWKVNNGIWVYSGNSSQLNAIDFEKNKRYYWKVEALNQAGRSVSDVFTFTAFWFDMPDPV